MSLFIEFYKCIIMFLLPLLYVISNLPALTVGIVLGVAVILKKLSVNENRINSYAYFMLVFSMIQTDRGKATTRHALSQQTFVHWGLINL